MLERKQKEKYRHRFPPGRLQEALQLVEHAAVLAAPLLAQFNFVLLHNGGKLRLGHGRLALRRLVFIKPAGIRVTNRLCLYAYALKIDGEVVTFPRA